MKFILTLAFLLSSSIFLTSCNKESSAPPAKLATGEYNGIYVVDPANPQYAVIIDSLFIRMSYEEGNTDPAFLTATVREDGSVTYKKTEEIQGLSFTADLDAKVTLEGNISGDLKTTALGKTSYSSVSMHEITETRNSLAGIYDGIYTGEVIKPWINSSENEPFSALIYGDVILIRSGLMGEVVGNIDSEGKFMVLSNRAGFMSGNLSNDGTVSGIFQFESGDFADKFQFSGIKYQPENI